MKRLISRLAYFGKVFLLAAAFVLQQNAQANLATAPTMSPNTYAVRIYQQPTFSPFYPDYSPNDTEDDVCFLAWTPNYLTRYSQLSTKTTCGGGVEIFVETGWFRHESVYSPPNEEEITVQLDVWYKFNAIAGSFPGWKRKFKDEDGQITWTPNATNYTTSNLLDFWLTLYEDRYWYSESTPYYERWQYQTHYAAAQTNNPERSKHYVFTWNIWTWPSGQELKHDPANWTRSTKQIPTELPRTPFCVRVTPEPRIKNQLLESVDASTPINQAGPW